MHQQTLRGCDTTGASPGGGPCVPPLLRRLPCLTPARGLPAIHLLCTPQSPPAEILDVRWANDDPNPRAVARVHHEREVALRDAYVKVWLGALVSHARREGGGERGMAPAAPPALTHTPSHPPAPTPAAPAALRCRPSTSCPPTPSGPASSSCTCRPPSGRGSPRPPTPVCPTRLPACLCCVPLLHAPAACPCARRQGLGCLATLPAHL